MEHAVLFREDTIAMDRFSTASREWRAVAGWLILLGLLSLAYFIGPLVPVLAWLIQRWAAAESWNARDRWASVGGFALCFGIIALILLVSLAFPVPWLSVGLSSLWQHFPLLGEYTLSNVSIRWTAGLLLAPALTIGLEFVQPRTIWYPERKHLSSEERGQRDTQAKAAKAVIPAESWQSTMRAQSPHTTPHRSKAPPSPERSRKQDTTQHHRQPVPKEHPGKPPPALQQQPKDREQKKPTRQPEPPPASTYNWNTGEGSLKDL